MTLPRTPKSEKKKTKKTPNKPEVKEEESGSADDAKKLEVTPVKVQLEEQRRKQKSREMEEQLKVLVRQREAAEVKLQRVKTALKTGVAAPNPNLRDVHFLKQQLRNVQHCSSKFGEYQSQIYALPLTVDQKTLHTDCELQFDTLYDKLCIDLTKLIEQLEKPAVAALVPAASANVGGQQFLPPLSVPLPKFDGSFEKWYSFKSMFQNIMARYPNEAPAIKLYHLRDSLVGKAAGVIDQEVVNNNDYDAAWAMLEELYEDKRSIIERHIENLFALPDITSDNATELQAVIDICVKSIEALRALNLPVNGLGEQMLVNLLATRMDDETRGAWEANQKAGELPTYEATITFLKEKRRVAEKLERNRQIEKVKPQCSVTKTKALVVASDVKDSVCDQDHEVLEREQFKQKSVNERYSHLRKYGLCFNCLKKGHRAGECTSTSSCQSCNKRHHTMLHKDGMRRPEITPASKKSTLLSTAVVQVYGGDGVPHQCRALIDSCSENHFVTERFANRLAARKETANYEVSGLNGGRTKISHLVRTTVKSRVTPFSKKLELLVTPRIIDDTPTGFIDVTSWRLPSDIELADPTFNKAGPVEMLLGAGVFWDLLKAGRIALADGLPSLRETELGWVVGGALPIQTPATASSFCGVSTRG